MSNPFHIFIKGLFVHFLISVPSGRGMFHPLFNHLNLYYRNQKKKSKERKQLQVELYVTFVRQ